MSWGAWNRKRTLKDYSFEVRHVGMSGHPEMFRVIVLAPGFKEAKDAVRAKYPFATSVRLVL